MNPNQLSRKEAEIVVRANNTFLSHYITGIVAGFGSAFFILRATKIPSRSWKGFWVYFTVGLVGEYSGRRAGVNSARLELEKLPQDSKMRLILAKVDRKEPIKFSIDRNTKEISIDIDTLPHPSIPPTDPSSSQPRINDNGGLKSKKNKWGDDIE